LSKLNDTSATIINRLNPLPRRSWTGSGKTSRTAPVTDKLSDILAFLTALNGSTPGELITAYFNFLQKEFPGMNGRLDEYSQGPGTERLLAGNMEILTDKKFFVFEFPLTVPNCGFFIRIADSDEIETISEYHRCFSLIFSLLLKQLETGRHRYTDMWANIVSRISHDLTALVRPGEGTADEQKKIEQKKLLLGQAVPKLLLYSRPLQLAPINISITVLLEAILEKSDFHGEFEYNPDPALSSVYTNCDVELIDMAVSELLSNGVFARKIQGGEILISTLHFPKTEAGNRPGWTGVQIRNTGASIPGEFLSLVKQPFFTTWGNQGRAGMGLALTEHIARAHGGDCRIEYDRVNGVKQSLFLPIVEINDKT